MAALLFEPYLPIDARSEIPVWVTVEQEIGVGKPAEANDLATVEFVVAVEKDREISRTDRLGMPYTFRMSPGDDNLLVRAIDGMREGGERVVTRRGQLLAVGSIVPNSGELNIRIRLVRVQKASKKDKR